MRQRQPSANRRPSGEEGRTATPSQQEPRTPQRRDAGQNRHWAIKHRQSCGVVVGQRALTLKLALPPRKLAPCRPTQTWRKQRTSTSRAQRKHRVSGTPVSVPRATTYRSIAISHPAHPSPPVNAPHTVYILAGVSNTRQMCRVPRLAGRWAVAEPSWYYTASCNHRGRPLRKRMHPC